ncbi:MAG: glutamine amidotransferase, partial [Eggerthellaceae bacterium]|nr:glutamine amidotransferase [Eggerthellaceae bacterium]
MSRTSPVRICHLYPEMLNLYGDVGNIICLKQRLLWRGIPCEIIPVRFGEKLSLSDVDMVFVGGGQDFEQEILLGDLKGNKANEIKAAVADDMPRLAICGGYQMLGHYYTDAQGNTLDYLSIVDFYTVASKERMVGNLAFGLNDDPSTLILGFENHGGKTYLGDG